MDIFRSTGTENYAKEERPLQAVRKMVLKGSVDVIFRRSDKPLLVVAGETAEAVASVKTYFNGSKLIIEREGITISTGNSRMVFHGSVGSFVSGDIVNDRSAGIQFSPSRVIVGLALPEAPTVKINGSGDVTLLDLQQSDLELKIEGSGDITVSGQVGSLSVEIAGSGDVDAHELDVDRATLSIAGSGDIEVLVRKELHARVAGSGDIVVKGNPPLRDHKVAGTGKIKFR